MAEYIEPFKFSSKLAISYRVRVNGNDYNDLAFVLRFALSTAATLPHPQLLPSVPYNVPYPILKKRTSTVVVVVFVLFCFVSDLGRL